LDIEIGDLVTLKGLSKQTEAPIGIVNKQIGFRMHEILWLNEDLATRFALVNQVKTHRLEVVSKALVQ
tara:strand:+ start:2463 stop:2666 length:204 start_codon:yes stop_codon:yes gene_type:complete